MCWLIRFVFLPLNSTEADEEAGHHVEPEHEGEGETGSEAEVEVESKAKAEGEPEGEAENTITHLSEAEQLPDITHKPSGAHQEGVEM